MIKKVILLITILLSIILVGYFIIPIIIPNKIEVEVNSDIDEIEDISVIGNIIKLHTKDVDTIDIARLGEYQTNYNYKYLFLPRSKMITIIVKDTISPEFKNFKEEITIYQNEQFYDEYNVTDNYDKEEDIKVEIEGILDITTVGDYYLVYTACDKSGNKTETERKVTVIKELPSDINTNSYRLEKYFPETILDKREEINEEYMDNIYLIGDSVYRNIERFNIYDKSKLWTESCLSPNNIYNKKIKIDKDKEYTVLELIEMNKPEYIVIHIGGCQISRAYEDVNTFIKEYTTFINDIKNKSPDTKIIIQTFNPVIERTVTPYINNTTRNKYNYLIAEMSEKLDIKVLDITSIFKDNNGNYKEYLYMEDKNHPNKEGLELIIEYIKTHSYQ